VTKRYHKSVSFSSLKRRKVELNFEGGDVTSDGGVVLLREIDKKLKLTESVSKAIEDKRHPSYCTHSQLTLLRQRIYGLALGYEDLNDHTSLRHDGALQTAAGELGALGSASTLCRLEQSADMSAAFKLHEILIDQFIASFEAPPKRLTLDFDATHDLVYGEQEKRYFNAFYDDYCFLPLYVFCGKQLLVSYLRPSSHGAAHNATAVLKLLTKRLREAWPKVDIVFRGDAGFCNPRLLNWCDRNRVDYVIGIGKNSVLSQKSEVIRTIAECLYRLESKNQKRYSEFMYKAGSWPRERRVIVKAEYNDRGENTRYVVTSLSSSARHLYAKTYCSRGDMENRIKEQKSLFSDRTSCHHWWPNQLRLLLSGFAYVLLDALRRYALAGTEFANSQVDTLRLRLLKIGGIITRNTRRIRIMLSSAYPHQDLFIATAKAINSS
jgi:hypothetical protein